MRSKELDDPDLIQRFIDNKISLPEEYRIKIMSGTDDELKKVLEYEKHFFPRGVREEEELVANLFADPSATGVIVEKKKSKSKYHVVGMAFGVYVDPETFDIQNLQMDYETFNLYMFNVIPKERNVVPDPLMKFMIVDAFLSRFYDIYAFMWEGDKSFIPIAGNYGFTREQVVHKFFQDGSTCHIYYKPGIQLGEIVNYVFDIAGDEWSMKYFFGVENPQTIVKKTEIKADGTNPLNEFLRNRRGL